MRPFNTPLHISVDGRVVYRIVGNTVKVLNDGPYSQGVENSRMQLFYWASVKALKQYAPGTVIVFALSMGQAIELAAADYKNRLIDEIPPLDEDDRAEIVKKVERYRHELANSECVVHNYPVAINLKGSE